MADTIHGFATLDDIRRVADVVKRVEAQPLSSPRHRARTPLDANQSAPTLLWGRTDSAVAAFTNGTATVWQGFPGVTVGDNKERAMNPELVVNIHAVGVALGDYHRVELHSVQNVPAADSALTVPYYVAWPMECEAEDRP